MAEDPRIKWEYGSRRQQQQQPKKVAHYNTMDSNAFDVWHGLCIRYIILYTWKNGFWLYSSCFSHQWLWHRILFRYSVISSSATQRKCHAQKKEETIWRAVIREKAFRALMAVIYTMMLRIEVVKYSNKIWMETEQLERLEKNDV